MVEQKTPARGESSVETCGNSGAEIELNRPGLPLDPVLAPLVYSWDLPLNPRSVEPMLLKRPSSGQSPTTVVIAKGRKLLQVVNVCEVGR